MSRAFLSITLASIFLNFSSYTPLAYANGVVTGAGDTSCSKILSDPPDGKYKIHPIYISWAQGMLSALSVVEDVRKSSSSESYAHRLRSTKSKELSDGIVKICKQKPMQDLFDTTMQIYRQMGGREFKPL